MSLKLGYFTIFDNLLIFVSSNSIIDPHFFNKTDLCVLGFTLRRTIINTQLKDTLLFVFSGYFSLKGLN